MLKSLFFIFVPKIQHLCSNTIMVGEAILPMLHQTWWTISISCVSNFIQNVLKYRISESVMFMTNSCPFFKNSWPYFMTLQKGFSYKTNMQVCPLSKLCRRCWIGYKQNIYPLESPWAGKTKWTKPETNFLGQGKTQTWWKLWKSQRSVEDYEELLVL